MANDTTLVRNFYLHRGFFGEQDALTAQAGFQAWIDGTVDEILLLVRYLLEELVSSLDIDMTGAAGTYPTAIMIQVNVVLLRYFENGQSFRYTGNRQGLERFVFKCEMYGSHIVCFCDVDRCRLPSDSPGIPSDLLQ
jgi:hypothetical protein